MDEQLKAEIISYLQENEPRHFLNDGDTFYSCPLATYDDGETAYEGEETGCKCNYQDEHPIWEDLMRKLGAL